METMGHMFADASHLLGSGEVASPRASLSDAASSVLSDVLSGKVSVPLLSCFFLILQLARK